jgi:hypothetical protein
MSYLLEAWGSHCSDCEDYCLPRHFTVSSGRSVPVFQRHFLDAIMRQFWQATIRFVMSVSLPVCMKTAQLPLDRLLWNFTFGIVTKMWHSFWFKTDKNNKHLTQRQPTYMHIYDSILPSLFFITERVFSVSYKLWQIKRWGSRYYNQAWSILNMISCHLQDVDYNQLDICC